MIQLKPTQLYAVKVSKSSKDFYISGMGYLCGTVPSRIGIKDYLTWNKKVLYHKVIGLNFVIGTYQSGKIDFDAMLLFNEKPLDSFGNTLYKDYVKDKYEHWNALDSFESLLEANQVPISDNEKYCILKLK